MESNEMEHNLKAISRPQLLNKILYNEAFIITRIKRVLSGKLSAGHEDISIK